MIKFELILYSMYKVKPKISKVSIIWDKCINTGNDIIFDGGFADLILNNDFFFIWRSHPLEKHLLLKKYKLIHVHVYLLHIYKDMC